MAERKEYSEKVSQLLKIGEPNVTDSQEWPNYPEQYGFGPADIPELIELATAEDTFNGADTDEEAETDQEKPPARVWGPVYAWRTLGQLRAESAIEPLLALLKWDDDWATEEVPQVYGLIGPAAIPALQGYIEANHEETYPAATAVNGLEQIVRHHAEAKEEVGRALTTELEKFADNDKSLNAFLVATLADLDLRESLPLIETAYEQKKVDYSIVNLDGVKHSFGLLSDEEYAKRQEQNRKQLLNELGQTGGDSKAAQNQSRGRKNQKAKAKVKRKMASASRKKNRKK